MDKLARQIHERDKAAGFTDQRQAHNAVFAPIPPEGITRAELARRAGMTKQAMSELVVDLEAKGYLTRRPDTQDKRTKIIELSDGDGRRSVQHWQRSRRWNEHSRIRWAH